MRGTIVLNRAAGILLLVAGSIVWSTRNEITTKADIETKTSVQLRELTAGAAHDLTAECEKTRNINGWILFLVEANLQSDAGVRTYFETSPEPYGLWLEYDQGTLRLGLGLGPNSVESSTEIPMRIVRRDLREVFAIGVTLDETRVVGNVTDEVSQWPGAFFPEWRCDQVQLGGDTEALSEGYKCETCNVRLWYTSGDDLSEIDDILDSFANTKKHDKRRWFGSALTLIGITIFLRKSGESWPKLWKRRT